MKNLCKIINAKFLLIVCIIIQTSAVVNANAQAFNATQIPFARSYEPTQNGTSSPNLTAAYTSMVSAAQGSRVVAGYSSFPLNVDNGTLLKLNRQGNPVWHKEYSTGVISRLKNISNISGGGIIASGASTTITNNVADPWVVSTDNNGVMNWSKIYTATGNYYVSDQLNTEYNNSPAQLIAGNSPGQIGISKNAAWFMMVDNSTGNLIWQKKLAYGTSGANTSLGLIGVEEHTNGSGYLAILNQSESQNGNGQLSNKIIALSIDTNGNFVWAKHYKINSVASESYPTLNDFIVLEDGSFELVGKYYPSLSGKSRGFVMRISSTGIVQWFKGFSRSVGASLEHFTVSDIARKNGKSVIGGDTLGLLHSHPSWIGVLNGTSYNLSNETDVNILPNVSSNGGEVIFDISYDGPMISILGGYSFTNKEAVVSKIHETLPEQQCFVSNYKVTQHNESIRTGNIHFSKSPMSLTSVDITPTTTETNLITLTTNQCQ